MSDGLNVWHNSQTGSFGPGPAGGSIHEVSGRWFSEDEAEALVAIAKVLDRVERRDPVNIGEHGGALLSDALERWRDATA